MRTLHKLSSQPHTGLSGRGLVLCVAGALLFAAACQTPEVSFDDLPPAETLYQEGVEKLEGELFLYVIPRVDYSGAIEIFQSIIDNYPYSNYAVLAELRIADAYFEEESYEESLSYYRDFADLHPQHEKVPYTILRSALSHYEQVSTVNRDQTNTREALIYLDRLIRQFPFAPETREGERVMRDLRERLARDVMQKGDFYLAGDEHQSAAARYRQVLNEYPGLDLDAEALYKLGLCYENMRRRDEALRLFHVVAENYATSDLAVLARERIAAAN